MGLGYRPHPWYASLARRISFFIAKYGPGVNLGGWLITEPFIVPALYEKYQNATPPAVDEWTLSEAMLNDTSPGGGIQQMEDHYKTFIVRSHPLRGSSLHKHT
jgi:glucan 1,3-beta-glucosidase